MSLIGQILELNARIAEFREEGAPNSFVGPVQRRPSIRVKREHLSYFSQTIFEKPYLINLGGHNETPKSNTGS